MENRPNQTGYWFYIEMNEYLLKNNVLEVLNKVLTVAQCPCYEHSAYKLALLGE